MPVDRREIPFPRGSPMKRTPPVDLNIIASVSLSQLSSIHFEIGSVPVDLADVASRCCQVQYDISGSIISVGTKETSWWRFFLRSSSEEPNCAEQLAKTCQKNVRFLAHRHGYPGLGIDCFESHTPHETGQVRTASPLSQFIIQTSDAII